MKGEGLFVKEFVEENDGDGKWCDPADKEDVETEEANAERTIVRYFVINQLPVESPTYKQTDDDATQGEDDFGRHEVKEVEKAETEDSEVVPDTHGEGTYHTEEDATNGHHPCCPMTADMPLLMDVGRNGFVQGYGTCQCRKHKQHIE